MARNFGAGAIEQENAAVEIGGEQAAAHGLDNVLIERLEVLEFLVAFPPVPRPSCGSFASRN